jgi:hypothetical protein
VDVVTGVGKDQQEHALETDVLAIPCKNTGVEIDTVVLRLTNRLADGVVVLVTTLVVVLVAVFVLTTDVLASVETLPVSGIPQQVHTLQ